MLSHILVTKLAHDAGFELEVGETSGWLEFGVPGQKIRAWLHAEGDGAIVALSRADVLRELETGSEWRGALPESFVGARYGASPDAVIAILARVRVLDRTLPQALLHEYQAVVASIEGTEALALVRQRRGQDLFRKGLMDYWHGRCALTGLDVPELLRASHAKPWKDSTDPERLDVHNGFLLAAHLDAAFDQGFITLDEQGRLVLSPALSKAAVATLGLDQTLSAVLLKPAHHPYLVWHRSKVFRSARDPEPVAKGR